MNPGRVVTASLVAVVLAGCGQAMSVEEAKRVTTPFTAAGNGAGSEAISGLGRAAALRQTMGWLIDTATLNEKGIGRVIATYAHPSFWAPFVLAGDGR